MGPTPSSLNVFIHIGYQNLSQQDQGDQYRSPGFHFDLDFILRKFLDLETFQLGLRPNNWERFGFLLDFGLLLDFVPRSSVIFFVPRG